MDASPQTGPTSVETVSSVTAVAPEQWDALVGPNDPFMEQAFLRSLERSGAVGGDTTWEPRYLVARRGDRLLGVLPAYRKWDSYGEFIFDWQWAAAYQRSGIPYYPKAVAAVPFTPVSGSRILVHRDADFEQTAATLVDALVEQARVEELSSIHVLFSTQTEQRLLERWGFLSRLTHQYHWRNPGYRSFYDYLQGLRSKRRKQVLRERSQVAASGLQIDVVCGDEIGADHMDAMWRFYQDTHRRHWTSAYLRRSTFDAFLEDCRSRLVLVLARERGSKGGGWVGGTLNFRKGSHLYGRYWGALKHYPALHFECCFYRLIEYAIETGVELFEAGAQGEQKFLRGFAGAPIYSSHWVAHPGGRAAIERFLEEERTHTRALIQGYNAVSPVKEVRRQARE